MATEKKGVIVVALTQRGKLLSAAFELLSAGRALADAAKEPLAAVVMGGNAGQLATELGEAGAEKVFVVESPALDSFNDELHTDTVGAIVEKEGFGRVLIPASVAGRSLAARLTVRLKGGLAPEAAEVYQNGAGLNAKRYQYSGNVIAEVGFNAPIQILTLQPMVYPRAERKAGRAFEKVAVPFAPKPSRIEFVEFRPEESNEVDLGAAERVVAGGRGLGTAEGFKVIRELAKAIGAAVGASRAVVDSGWIPYRHQVGLTGRAVRPKLYIACGISGQIQHLAGMSSSGTIVAVNTDPECPMMQLASISVVGDLFEILPVVVEEIKRRKGGAA